MMMHVPTLSPGRWVRISTSLTATMLGKASPLKPMVWSVNKSSARLILDVACRSKAIRASIADIPQPLSTT